MKTRAEPDDRYGCVVRPLDDGMWEWEARFHDDPMHPMPFTDAGQLVAQGSERSKRQAVRAADTACLLDRAKRRCAWEAEQETTGARWHPVI